MKDHYLMFAAYNAWANDILYKAVAKLSDEQFHRDCGAFFGSVHGTLNHLLVGDNLWMSRFQRKESNIKSQDTVLHEDFDGLKFARSAMDVQIIEFVQNLSKKDLESELEFQTILNPVVITHPFSLALAHFFNHQTHHRGQVHGLLSQLTDDAPPLDLMYYQREQMGK